MGLVTLDADALTEAISEMESLASAIRTRSATSRNASPITLPSLTTTSTVANTATWLDDQVDNITVLRDLARLLASDGSTSIQVNITGAQNPEDFFDNAETVLGDNIAELLAHLPIDDKLDVLAPLLERYSDNENVSHAIMTSDHMSPYSLMMAMDQIGQLQHYGDEDTDYENIAESLRDTLASASRQFSDAEANAFANELARIAGSDTNPSPYGPSLAYLMDGRGGYGDTFLLGLAAEIENGIRSGQHYSGHPIFPTDGHDMWADPLAPIMDQLSDHPFAAQQFLNGERHDDNGRPVSFADPDWSLEDRMSYYTTGHLFHDGTVGFTNLVAAASATPEAVGNDAELSAQIASHFMNKIGDRGEGELDPEGMGPALGQIAQLYTPAIMASMDSGHPNAGAVEMPIGGELIWMPRLDDANLIGFLDLTMDSDDGLAGIVNGRELYLQSRLAGGTEVLTAIQEDVVYQGFLEGVAGSELFNEAEEAQARRQAMSKALSTVVGIVPIPGSDLVGEGLGELGKNFYAAIWKQGTTFGSNEAAELIHGGDSPTAVLAYNAQQQDISRMSATLGTFDQMVDAGMITADDVPAEYRDLIAPNGQLITGRDYMEALATAGEDDFDDAFDDALRYEAAVSNILESTSGGIITGPDVGTLHQDGIDHAESAAEERKG